MLTRILERITPVLNYNPSHKHRSLLYLGFIAFVFAIEGLGYMQGINYRLSLLYLFPIAAAAWLSTGYFALTLVLLTTIRWFYWLNSANNIPHSAIVWDLLIETISLLIFAGMVLLVKYYFVKVNTLTNTDHLTGLLNRKGFLELATPLMALTNREEKWCSLVYFDIDNFKNINDRFGHEEGNRILRLVAKYVDNHLRSTDIKARVGGDEFAIFMPSISPDYSLILIRELDRHLTRFVKEERLGECSFSYGIASTKSKKFNLDALISAADSLMYQVKERGKADIRQEILIPQIN